MSNLEDTRKKFSEQSSLLKRKSELIRKMLDVEYAFWDDMTRDEREALDIERQMFAFRMGWPRMSVEELEEQALYMGLNVDED